MAMLVTTGLEDTKEKMDSTGGTLENLLISYFNDFIGNPGDEPYIHLTPGNNYQWNTKSDQNDRNNGCLCKSQESTSEIKSKESECPSGWVDVGASCIQVTEVPQQHPTATGECQAKGAELLSWTDRGEWLTFRFTFAELCVEGAEGVTTGPHWTGANTYRVPYDGPHPPYMWGDGPSSVPLDYGWNEGSNTDNTDNRHGAFLYGCEGVLHTYTIAGVFPFICQIRKQIVDDR